MTTRGRWALRITKMAIWGAALCGLAAVMGVDLTWKTIILVAFGGPLSELLDEILPTSKG